MMNGPGVSITSGGDLGAVARSEALRRLAAGRLAARRWRLWLGFVACAFSLSSLASVLFLPQSYTSTVSLAIVAPTEVGGGLLSMAVGGGGTPTSKYVGMLHSRRFAEMAEERVHLQHLYHLPGKADAVEAIMANLKVKDNAHEGLIEVSESLSGPAILAPGRASARESIRQAAAQVVNVYADLLRDYMAHSDIDRDAILLQGAQDKIRQVRAEYDVAVGHLAHLVQKKGANMGDAVTAMGMTGETGSGGAIGPSRDLVSLYALRATLESDIQASTVALKSLKARQGEQLQHVDTIPAEDPMLMQARAAVGVARSDVEALRLQYGPDNPKVMVAQDRLRIAEDALTRQRDAVRLGRTSPRIDAEVKLDALQKRREVLLQQIEEEQAKARLGREFLTEFERRRGEVMLRLEVLKAASAHAATLSMQTVAASKKLSVVDTGIPARRGSPGLAQIALLSLFLSLFALAAWIVPDYARAVREVMQNDIPTVQPADARSHAA